MKILVLNGSPRMHGNTHTALNAVVSGIESNITGVTTTVLALSKLRLSGCINCDGCKRNGGTCVIPDDSASVVQQIYDADAVVFGTPVYWWGVSAQLKMAVDKMYSKDDAFQKQKKLAGTVAVGGNPLANPQYRLISEQFTCICKYLGWNLVFSESISAWAPDDLAKDQERVDGLKKLWEKLVA